MGNPNGPFYICESVGCFARLLGERGRRFDGARAYLEPLERRQLLTTTFVSDLTPTAATNGYGQYEKDKSNGENYANDGVPIKLNGVTYAKGLGTHANSDITYSLGGAYATFITDIGIEDEITAGGSVIFRVYLDGVSTPAEQSVAMNSASPSLSWSVNVTGKNTLRLVTNDSGNGNTYDHADWAGARLDTGAPTAPAAPTATHPWGTVLGRFRNPDNREPHDF